MIGLLKRLTRGVSKMIRNKFRSLKRNCSWNCLSITSVLYTMNLLFALVELYFGLLNDSWGLQSDSVRLFFDGSAILMDSIILTMKKWLPNAKYNYGYHRIEALGRFGVALSQVYIAVCQIFLPAIPRLIGYVQVGPDRVFRVSLMLFMLHIVNSYILNIQQQFCHTHVQGREVVHCHIHHKDNPTSPVVKPYTIMEQLGIIFSDTMGSICLVISSFMIEEYGYMYLDPLSSMIIAASMINAAIPILKDTTMILMQRSPTELDDVVIDCLNKIIKFPGVNQVLESRFWILNDGNNVGTLKLQVTKNVNHNKVVEETKTIFYRVGVEDLTVELNYKAD